MSLSEIFPIQFSIPEEIFNNKIEKIYDLAPLIPGDKSTYIYKTEKEYYEMYGKSKFALTFKKGGFDCMRHYEILANNCIPLFKNIGEIPEKTMFRFPKKFLSEIYDKYHKNEITDAEYFDYSKQLYEYSKTYLNCKSMAQYLLDKIEYKENQKILFLICQNVNHFNYLRESILIGLRRCLNDKVVDYPKKTFLYENNEFKQEELYGMGFSYSSRLKDIDIDRTNIEEKIKSHHFDFIIYGNVGYGWCQNDRHVGNGDARKNLPFWKTVKDIYPKNKIIFIYGSDRASNNAREKDHLNFHSKYGICFVRELV